MHASIRRHDQASPSMEFMEVFADAGMQLSACSADCWCWRIMAARQPLTASQIPSDVEAFVAFLS